MVPVTFGAALVTPPTFLPPVGFVLERPPTAPADFIFLLAPDVSARCHPTQRFSNLGATTLL